MLNNFRQIIRRSLGVRDLPQRKLLRTWHFAHVNVSSVQKIYTIFITFLANVPFNSQEKPK